MPISRNPLTLAVVAGSLLAAGAAVAQFDNLFETQHADLGDGVRATSLAAGSLNELGEITVTAGLSDGSTAHIGPLSRGSTVPQVMLRTGQMGLGAAADAPVLPVWSSSSIGGAALLATPGTEFACGARLDTGGFPDVLAGGFPQSPSILLQKGEPGPPIILTTIPNPIPRSVEDVSFVRLNSGRMIACATTWEGQNTDWFGIWTNDEGDFEAVASNHTDIEAVGLARPIRPLGLHTSSGSGLLLDDEGDVLFSVTGSGWWTFLGKPGSWEAVGQSGSQAPGFPAGVNMINQNAPLSLSANGRYLILGEAGGTDVIWQGRRSSLASRGIVVRGTDQPPGAPAGAQFHPFSNPLAAVSSYGRVAFLWSLDTSHAGVDASNDTGLWAWEEGDGLSLIAIEGGARPDGGTWDNFRPP